MATRASRACRGKQAGYYKKISELELEDDEMLVLHEETGSMGINVYEVDRLVEKRVIKVNTKLSLLLF